MLGPPGSGKTVLLRAIADDLPKVFSFIYLFNFCGLLPLLQSPYPCTSAFNCPEAMFWNIFAARISIEIDITFLALDALCMINLSSPHLMLSWSAVSFQ